MEIRLIVRGVCAVIGGRPGLSDHITVQSVVGRFLEHSRVYWFHRAGTPACFIGSADLMERNLNRRVEILVPIKDAVIRQWLRETYLQRYLDDTERTRVMRPDGSYKRIRNADSRAMYIRSFSKMPEQGMRPSSSVSDDAASVVGEDVA